ncbi:MAG TPA: hypothetical protein VL360_01920 [Gammaproteobacteria bacterium]|jgi:hypothetical protein|nr:hypothetical protein [Gammaproteobacteria bacterium]
MSIWEGLPDEELHIILDCDNLREVKKRLRRRRSVNESEWINAARMSYQVNEQEKLFIERLIYSISDATSPSYLVLLSVIGSITVAFIPLTIMTAVLSAVAMSTGIFFYASSYQVRKEQRDEIRSKIDFNAIKILCADEIINRKKSLLLQPKNTMTDIPVFEYELDSKAQKSRDALGFGLLTSILFFGTYYSGLAILLNSFGLAFIASAMLGPVGMSVALAAAIGIGILCTYVHYKAIINKDKIEKFEEFQKEQIKDKRFECDELDKKLKTLSPQPAKSLSAPSLRWSHKKLRSQDDALSAKMLESNGFTAVRGNVPKQPPLPTPKNKF